MNKEAIERAANAMIESFKDTVSRGAAVPFDETGVSVPNQAVFERYAEAAITAYFDSLEPVAYAARENIDRLQDEPGEMFLASKGTFRPENETPLFTKP